MTTIKGYIVPVEEFRDFVVRCSKSVGIAEDHAGSLAEMVVSADYRGHYSHGLKNLGQIFFMQLFYALLPQNTS
jgi:LDH2 family malate/lactate/ureidoglycolate dehydrogenase